MHIGKVNLDMLYRFVLAGHFTSPSVPATYSRTRGAAAIRWLVRKQLIRHDGGRFVITPDGRAELEANLDAARLAIVHRLEQRKAGS